MEPVRIDRCPLRPALKVIGGKWKPIILFHLIRNGVHRFGQLRRLFPDATQKMLTQQLRELERDGVIARKVYHQVPPKVEYSLTAFGRTLIPLMIKLCRWGQKHHSRLAKRRASNKK